MAVMLKRLAGERAGIKLPDGRWVFVSWQPRQDGSGATLLAIDAPRDLKVLREELIPKEELTHRQLTWEKPA